MMRSVALYERYRPSTWAEVIGQGKAVKTLDRLRKAGGLSGRCYWITGASGTGKTTIARLIAAEVASKWATEEIDASECTAGWIDSKRDNLHTRGWGEPGGKCYIINEAHGLTSANVRRLLTLLEGLPPHVTFIFTTTTDGQLEFTDGHIDAHPLLSRCHEIALSRRDLARGFADRAREIAKAEGLDGAPSERYVRLVQEKHNNMRAVLQAVESGAMLAE